jgi:chromosome segregation ATPase
MDAIIRTKNHEIEEQIREKENQKDNYNQEVERLNADIEMWRYKHNQVERQKDKEVFEKNRIIEEKENNFNEYSKKCENHIYTLNQEVQALKQLLEHNAFNLEESNRQYRFIREGLEEDLRNAKNTIREIEDNALQVSHQKDQQLNQIRSEMF